MRLVEFQATKLGVSELINGLKQKLRLIQLGGPKRMFRVGKTGDVGIIYIVSGTTKAVGISWVPGQKTVSTVYIWRTIDIDTEADIAIDIPVDAAIDSVVDQLGRFIDSPRIGMLESLMEAGEEDQKTPEFKAKLRPKAPQSAEATKAVQPEPAAEVVPQPVAQPTPAPKPTRAAGKPDDDLEKLKKLSQKGNVVLMGRRADGTLFELPNATQRVLTKLQTMVDYEVKKATGGKTMDEQYEDMKSKVRMVAAGKNRFIKSILITGRGGTGKSFGVMQVLKELGLVKNQDYVLKTGKVTPSALFRLFIEQNDGLTVFDDCDSVWDDEASVNMMKGALDTNAVRTISNDTKASMNMASAFPGVEVGVVMDAMSRILRGVPGIGDLELFDRQVKLLSKTDDSEEAFEQDLFNVQKKIMDRLPNTIEFEGSVIFISNRDEKDFDKAMFTRVDHINVDFTDEEMLDYIEKIADRIENNGDVESHPLTPDQISEVMQWIRHCMENTGFTARINFRFIQKCFDYRRNQPNWKDLVAAL